VSAATPARRGPGRPRNGDSVGTRSAILDAAVVEFARHGLAGTPVRRVCDRAGVADATLYHHFGSKRGLYVAAFNHAIRLAYLRYEDAVAGASTLRDELRAMLECALEIMDDHHEITALAIRAQTDLTEEELDANFDPQVSLDFVAGMTARATARGELDPADGPLLDAAVGGLLWGLSIVGRDRRTRVAFVEAVERLVDGALFRVGPVDDR
jgi:AcrR family transcriptional regulator